ncbi:MAG: hypothetical protein ACRYFX_05750 [Janthinobacterium lividum]
MKTPLLLLSLGLPLAAGAQKLVATHSPKVFKVGSEKAFLYRALTDTAAGKAGFFLYPGAEATVVGEFSPRWAVVKREGFLYITPTTSLKDYSSATVLSPSEKRLRETEAKYEVEHRARVAALKTLDDKNGFRAYHFGESITAYPGLKQRTAKGRSLQYADPTENLHIGEADLKSVTYFFYKGKLSSVVIETDGLINSTKVREALETQYGKGRKFNNLIENYDWEGEKVDLLYNENSISRDAMIIFSSKALRAEETVDDKAAAKKATSDL